MRVWNFRFDHGNHSVRSLPPRSATAPSLEPSILATPRGIPTSNIGQQSTDPVSVPKWEHEHPLLAGGNRTLIHKGAVEGQAMKKWQMPIITLIFVAAFVILYFNGLLGNTAVP